MRVGPRCVAQIGACRSPSSALASRCRPAFAAAPFVPADRALASIAGSIASRRARCCGARRRVHAARRPRSSWCACRDVADTGLMPFAQGVRPTGRCRGGGFAPRRAQPWRSLSARMIAARRKVIAFATSIGHECSTCRSRQSDADGERDVHRASAAVSPCGCLDRLRRPAVVSVAAACPPFAAHGRLRGRPRL